MSKREWVALMIILTLAFTLIQQQRLVNEQRSYIYSLEGVIDESNRLISLQEEAINMTRQHNENLETINETLLETIETINVFFKDFFDVDAFEAGTFEITAYAPLDPNAVEGMCYAGDPNITFSGARVEVGKTIAVDPSVIPMGTKVWIEGFGWREAQDTGGLIKGNVIDVAVATRKDAFEIGRKQARVIYAVERPQD